MTNTLNKKGESFYETSTDLQEIESPEENEVLDFETDLTENEPDSINSSLIISDDENEYSIELSLPGFEPEDITIEIENNILSIEAKTETEKSEKEDRFTRKEFSYNSYSRSFKLPENLENEKLKAEYKEGILKLTFPKVEITSLDKKQEALLL